MAFARAGGSFLLAGEPVHAWRPGDGGDPQLDTADTSLGVVFDQFGEVAALPRPPLTGRATDIRLLAEGDGYAAVFAQKTERIGRDQAPTLLGYWFGRTDGRQWHSLEPLPLPPSGPLNTSNASRLVGLDGALVIAAPVGPHGRQDVAVYTRTRDGWAFEIVPTRRAVYVALAAVANRPFLYVVWPDTTRPRDSNSLSLFVRDSEAWRHYGVLVRGGRQPVLHPTVISQGDIQILSWIADDDDSRTRRALAARLLSDGTLGPSVTLAQGIEDVFPVHDATGTSRWVLSTRAADGQSTLTLVEWGAGEPEIRDEVVNPFTGPALAYATLNGDVIVGPVMGRPPREEVVVSGILRLASRCRSRNPGETR